MSSKTAVKYGKEFVRNRELKYVKLGLMKVSPLAQRELNKARVDYLYSIFDPDKFQIPEVSFREGHYFVMNGQHGIEALKKWNGKGWEDVHIQCWVAYGLTEQQEAEIFLSLNDYLQQKVFQKFKIAVTAGRETENDIVRIVNSEQLMISQQKAEGAISGVGTLIRVYKRDGPEALRKTLAIIRDAYGTPGFSAPVINGIGLMIHRYNNLLNQKDAIESLKISHGGVNGLLAMAEKFKAKTGNQMPHCVAGAAVTIINRGRTPKNKLADWWKE